MSEFETKVLILLERIAVALERKRRRKKIEKELPGQQNLFSVDEAVKRD